MKSSWIDFWDAKERMQGPFWDTYAAFFAEHVRAVIPFAHSDILLDLGCGNGKILSLLAPSVQAAYGLDTSPSLIKRCKSDYAHIQNMFFDTIPQQDYTNISSLDLPPFNIIICSSILQYYESPAHVKALLVDLKKIIAPNALLLFADMLLDYNILRDLAGSLYGGIISGTLWYKIRGIHTLISKKYIDMRQKLPLLTLSHDEFYNICRQAGFEIRHIRYQLTANSSRKNFILQESCNKNE